MVCSLIDFPLVVLKLLMFEVCAIVGISKINFFNFSAAERVNVWRYYAQGQINDFFPIDTAL